MTKLVLDDLPAGFNRQRIDSNFTKIEQEFQDKVLYRDNPTGEPNQMENDLDMNGNSILNVTGLEFTEIILGTTKIVFGTGSPESVVTANQGSLFLRTDGGPSTTLYVKESGSGNTGWVAK